MSKGLPRASARMRPQDIENVRQLRDNVRAKGLPIPDSDTAAIRYALEIACYVTDPQVEFDGLMGVAMTASGLAAPGAIWVPGAFAEADAEDDGAW